MAPECIGAFIDKGDDFPSHIRERLEEYGPLWLWRDRPGSVTTRALNSYKGDVRKSVEIHLSNG
jgi:hypothetical protein